MHKINSFISVSLALISLNLSSAAAFGPEQKVFPNLADAKDVLVVIDMSPSDVGDPNWRHGDGYSVERYKLIHNVYVEIEKAKKQGSVIVFLELFSPTLPLLINAVLDYPKTAFLVKEDANGAPEIDTFFRQHSIDPRVKLTIVGVSFFCCVQSTILGLKEMGYDFLHLILRATDFYAYPGKLDRQTYRNTLEHQGILIDAEYFEDDLIAEYPEIDPRTYNQIAGKLIYPLLRGETVMMLGELNPKIEAIEQLLVEMLEDPDLEVVEKVIIALAKIEPASLRVRQNLVTILQNPEVVVRIEKIQIQRWKLARDDKEIFQGALKTLGALALHQNS